MLGGALIVSVLVHALAFALVAVHGAGVAWSPESTEERAAEVEDALSDRALDDGALRLVNLRVASRDVAAEPLPEGEATSARSAAAEGAERSAGGEAVRVEPAGAETVNVPSSNVQFASAVLVDFRAPAPSERTVDRSERSEPASRAARAAAQREAAERAHRGVVFRAASDAAREAEGDRDRAARRGSDGLPRTVGDGEPVPGRDGVSVSGGGCRIPQPAINRPVWGPVRIRAFGP